MKLKKAQLILVIGILIVVPFVCWKRCANTDNSPKQEEYTDSTGKVHAPPWYLGVSDKEVEVQENLSQKNYYIIFDGSGSMSDSKIVDAKKAVKRFVNIIPEGANIGILVFDNLGIFERSPLGAKRENIIMQINKIMPRGRTPLGKSIEISYEKLAEQARKQLGYGEYNLVIITDGIETDGFTMTNVVEKILQDSPRSNTYYWISYWRGSCA